MMRSRTVPGFLLGAAAMIAATYGAHGLGRLDVAHQAMFETAVRYQMYHALLLVALGLAPAMPCGRIASLGVGAIALGVAAFSGSLYAIACGGPRPLGWVAAAGGSLLIVGWAALAIAACKAAATPNVPAEGS